MKRLLVLVVLLSALAIGCTPGPQPSVGGGGSSNTAVANTTVSNTTVSNTTNE